MSYSQHIDTADDYKKGDFAYLNELADDRLCRGYLVEITQVCSDHYAVELVADENDDDIEGSTYVADYELESERGSGSYRVNSPPTTMAERSHAKASDHAKSVYDARRDRYALSAADDLSIPF